MQRRRMHFPLRYRRARSLLIIIGLFWLWLCFGTADAVAGLSSPLHAALVLYAVAVSIPVTLAAAVLAALRMVLMHPRRNGVVVRLPATPKQPPRQQPALEVPPWSYGEKAS